MHRSSKGLMEKVFVSRMEVCRDTGKENDGARLPQRVSRRLLDGQTASRWMGEHQD